MEQTSYSIHKVEGGFAVASDYAVVGPKTLDECIVSPVYSSGQDALDEYHRLREAEGTWAPLSVLSEIVGG